MVNIGQIFHQLHNALRQRFFSQQNQQLFAVTLIELDDDFVFIAEMIIEITRADAQIGSDMIGADFYAEDAQESVRIADKFINESK